ncbi:MAG: hypothetical protein E6H51_06470 [Betaproteobacteria bacterium]|nr:MAG: hypothetical protein E6H51_06470 [Betaproteobacteria bacterium]
MRIVLALATSLIFSGFAAAASVEDDVQRYIQIFSGEKNLHNDAADTFSWMGLSDTRLFDIVERRLLEDADASRDNRNERNRVARYIRSLGFSGQTKYEPTIKKFLGDVGYNRFAQAALQDLPDYNKWNPIISNRSSFDPKFSDNVNRVANMLRSDDLLLQRVGAKRVYFDSKDDILLELLAQKLRGNYARTDLDDRERSDSVAWQAKALGSSKNEKYVALLREVAEKAVARHVVTHATEALAKYYGIRNR